MNKNQVLCVVCITVVLETLLSEPAWCEATVYHSDSPMPSAIIPDNRTAPWQGNVGVPAGIPNRTAIYVNIVTDLGADPTGLVDCSAIIQSAINNCPDGQVVYIPAGRFRAGTQITLSNSKSSRTIRGAGMGATVVFSTNNNNVFNFGSATWPPPSTWVSISSGATKGSNTITVADTTAFVVGAPMAIGPGPLPIWAHNLGGYPDTYQTIRAYCKISSKTSTTVTFDPPCPFDFSGMNAMALLDPTPMLQGVGIESLTLDMSNSTGAYPIWFSQAWGCWIKDVEISHAYSRQMLFSLGIRCEVRGCYTHDVQGTGPNHEGIIVGPGSWNLIEDNICNNGGAPPIVLEDGINPGNFASCNVIGYNYVINTSPGFWDISFNHGSGSILNLAEGNVINNFEDDGYFGSSSLNTLSRNRIAGMVKLKHFSDYYNVVGNVLGDTGVNYYDAPETSGYCGSGATAVYELGFPNIGNCSFSGTFGPTTPPVYSALPNTLDGCQQLDYNVKTTILRHGNFDYFTNSTVWDPSIADHTIPNSLYYSGQPGWWPVGVAWPPIGPDLVPMIRQIPAEIRFLTQSTPTPTPTVTPTPTATPVPTTTPTPTSTPTPTATTTPTASPSPTATPTPCLATVPNFVGAKILSAQTIWESAGFTTKVTTNGPPGHRISSQSLPPGYQGDCSTTMMFVSD
jgi:Pectate lyase superfamily protein